MLSVVLKKGQSFWVGAVCIHAQRLGTENVDLWCEGPRSIPINRTGILVRMTAAELDALGYARTESGLLIAKPSQVSAVA